MKVNLAHLREQGIDFAVFEAEAVTHMNSDRDRLLGRLVALARSAGLKIDKAVLAFSEGGRVTFYGAPDLANFLARAGWIPHWTHSIDA